MERGMRIGELAERAGVTTRTIRYYESLGLLAPTHREGSGFRYYDEGALKRLHKIDWMKRVGLTLEEIATVIPLYFDEQKAPKGRRKLLELLERHLEETDEKIEQLAAFRDDLRDSVERIRGAVQAER